jgi:lipopolysaccharide/colanic/teichoic acid biosynthesis glycosyltransferase
MFLVWIQDWHSPFYIAPRVGKKEKLFRMFKLRSMIVNADKSGVDSTSSNDKRITGVGRFIRKYKLDELTQLWNVLLGDMSLVGPRPNVKRETDLYTLEEKKLLTVKPGITDFSSIVFSDEGDILKDQIDPDIAYNQLIRPGKSMLGIFYIENRNFLLDIKLIFLTIVAIVSKEKALVNLVEILRKFNANSLILQIASRQENLVPMPPPGAKNIVTNREGRVE